LIDFGKPIIDAKNERARLHVVPDFHCPTDSPPRQFDLLVENNSERGFVRLATSNYIGVFGTRELEECEGLPAGVVCRGDGVFFHVSHTRFAQVRDGMSNTLLVGERASRFGHSTWVGALPGGDESIARILGIVDHPPNAEGGHLDDFSSEHPAGTNFLMGDGSVRLISETIDLELYRALATRDGGETISLSHL
jgi:prepilin-type processing-associated H-X9-DG protein